jgi:hypothetical protein
MPTFPKHIFAAVAFLLSALPITAEAQRAASYQRIEVWGLEGESEEDFVKRLEEKTGMGAEGACMATLRKEFGYEDALVYIWTNREQPDSSTMLISIRDVPPAPTERLSAAQTIHTAPAAWSRLMALGREDAAQGFQTLEFQFIPPTFADFKRGDSAAVNATIEEQNQAMAGWGHSIDAAKVTSVLEAITRLRSSDPSEAISLFLHADSLADRRAAALVLLNHLDRAEVIEAYIAGIWDKQVAHLSTNIVSLYTRGDLGTPDQRVLAAIDGRVLAALLNHPSPSVATIGLRLLAMPGLPETTVRTALGGGALTVRYFLRSRLSAHMQTAVDYRREAITALRVVSPGDYLGDVDAWVRWIDSMGK